jgi:uncharacterized protein YbjT (DUF2867 family)
MPHSVFIAGGTGYIGTRFIPELLARGHAVRALVRQGSEHKLPAGCTPVHGNALDASTFLHLIHPADTYVHLVGVAHPGPAKANLFKTIDLVSIQQAVLATKQARISHFVYVSVAQPAPVMKEYIAVRAEGERLLRDSGMNATILRPWYVLGPGHRWPYLLKPVYWVMEKIPATRGQAKRLGLVTLGEMVSSLMVAVEHPPRGVRVIEVPEMKKRLSRSSAEGQTP